MTGSPKARPVVLCILDGWGERDEPDFNAIAVAATPVWDRLKATCPHARLDASGGEVGLPAGQMGNSEVGHMNIGAGRVVMQDLPRIDAAVADGSLANLPVLSRFVTALGQTGGTAHVMGLMSPGGVHSHQDHIAALANILCDAGVPVAVHAFLDGRDTPPASARGYLEDFIRAAPRAGIATVSGRYYAMDRDKRWQRVEMGYAALAEGEGVRFAEPLAAIDASYADSVTDEFMLPAVIGEYSGMRDGDGILMVNFRADRAREILAALLDPQFDGFARGRRIAFAAAAGMVEYSTALAGLMESLFPTIDLPNVLGQVVADAGLRQLRMAAGKKNSRGRTASSSRRPGSRPTICSPKCPRRWSPTGWSRRSPAASTTSWSSTTRTPTWWGTPDLWRRRSRRSPRWTIAWAGWRRRCAPPVGRC